MEKSFSTIILDTIAVCVPMVVAYIAYRSAIKTKQMEIHVKLQELNQAIEKLKLEKEVVDLNIDEDLIEIAWLNS